MFRIICVVAVCSYLTLVIFVPLSMSGMSHHEAGMGDCPFMIGEAAICEMNALDHIASWQSMTTALPPEVAVLFLLLAAAFLAFGIFRHLFDPPDPVPILYASPEFRQSLFRSLLLGSAISPRAP